MSFVFATIALGTLGALVYKDKIVDNYIDVKSSVNGKTYRVINTGDVLAVADTLAILEDRARDFVTRASKAYPLETQIKRIMKYWTGTLTEIPQTETIAYALEKKDVFICVRDSVGNIQDIDDLFFVLLHELSHIQNDTYGHDDMFWKQFKKTLEIANRLGSLPYKDYDNYNVMVCGKVITSNPMTCVSRGECFSELKTLRPL
ncbi:hypothetical protein PBCVNY2B_707L [Paramecium bursaria Chlorella virus NY2B]|uniref:hypothetical protein n=1 Tax=Paramecium bursaria Chlorella virus AR158 TaxID=380598 RepID=UPI00015AA7D6|nr:hypothetical protein AR158_C621L [Paramecium bursaria Chlorella virus AR158]ABU44166.1 hypothetical protein AR158_C621L [Paramecium bursaria Chlorella virus AR158]AGE58473.1 hypothetical protein PBCVNY2B_707L [Paramecium bursaria Chlorella virus NY2B]